MGRDARGTHVVKDDAVIACDDIYGTTSDAGRGNEEIGHTLIKAVDFLKVSRCGLLPAVSSV